MMVVGHPSGVHQRHPIPPPRDVVSHFISITGGHNAIRFQQVSNKRLSRAALQVPDHLEVGRRPVQHRTVRSACGGAALFSLDSRIRIKLSSFASLISPDSTLSALSSVVLRADLFPPSI